MDGELLRWLYHRLLHDPTLAHTRNCTYGDGLVLLVYFYAALNDRSPLWASDRRNWPTWCRAALVALPSYSQLNKRLKTDAIARAMPLLDAELRQRLPRGPAKVADGKPLVVGGFSHDPDARRGKVPAGWARGYKLHVIIDGASGAVEAHALTPLDAGEATVLRRDLLPCVDLCACTLRNDGNYDSNPTYAAVADAGGRMIAPRRRPGTGLGHDCHQHPDRLRAIDELECAADGRAVHRAARNRAEQSLAHLTNLPFGLWALPNFVRRLPRVRMWVAAKIVLYHLYKVLSRTRAETA